MSLTFHSVWNSRKKSRFRHIASVASYVFYLEIFEIFGAKNPVRINCFNFAVFGAKILFVVTLFEVTNRVTMDDWQSTKRGERPITKQVSFNNLSFKKGFKRSSLA